MSIFDFLQSGIDALTNPIVDALAGGDIYGVRTEAGGGNPDPLTFTQANWEAEEWNSHADVGAHITPYEDWSSSSSEPYPGYYDDIAAIGDGLSQFPGAMDFIEDHGLNAFLNGEYPEETGYSR